MKTLMMTTALILAASSAGAENICYRVMNPLDYQCRYDAERNRCDCREIKHGETRQQSAPKPDPEPECTGKCEPDRETDPEGWQDWRDKTPRDHRGEGRGAGEYSVNRNEGKERK